MCSRIILYVVHFNEERRGRAQNKTPPKSARSHVIWPEVHAIRNSLPQKHNCRTQVAQLWGSLQQQPHSLDIDPISRVEMTSNGGTDAETITRRTALLFAISSLPCASPCPGSPSPVHASCEMTVTFPRTKCDAVREEILARLQGENQWKDPHNGGVYTLLSDTTTTVTSVDATHGSRRTGDGKYTDLFAFTFTERESVGCTVKACSESQVFSILDFSTNYCNLFNLYCNSSDGCPVVKHELEYKEEYNKCSQRTKENCFGSAKRK
jgi:hypothetical protein